MRLTGETDHGDRVVVRFDLDTACVSCGGSGVVAHPGWLEFVAAHAHLGMPLAEIGRVYGPVWWKSRGGEPPATVTCEACAGRGRTLTEQGREILRLVKDYWED